MGTLFGCILHSRPTVYFQSQPWKVLVVACGRAIHKIPPEYRIAFRGMSNVLDRYPQGAADEGFYRALPRGGRECREMWCAREVGREPFVRQKTRRCFDFASEVRLLWIF